MGRSWERRLGRLLAGTGASAGVAYLGWRAAFSMAGVPGWLALPAFGVEVAGVVASVLLVWAVWRSAETPSEDTRDLPDVHDEIDVVIRCNGQPLGAARASLSSSMDADGRLLLDLTDDPGLRELAMAYDARYLAVPGGDLDGLGGAAGVLHRPLWLVLDAGDVIAPSALDVLRSAMDDPRIAIVVAPATEIERDGTDDGRALAAFERRTLWPRLGERGIAAFHGSAALIRAEAVVGRSLGTASPAMVGAQLTTDLLTEGWRIVAPSGEPVIEIAAPLAAEDGELRDACEASAARWLVAGQHGALGRGRFEPRRRLGLLAQAVGPLSGVHRGAFVLVLLAAQLNGTLPFRPDPGALLLTWMPWFVLTPLGLMLLSGRSLRPGQRSSSSMRLLGPSWRGLLTPNGRPDRPGLALAGAFGVRHGAALSGAVALVSIVLSLRGLSDRVTHTMQPMPRPEAIGLLAVTMWTLAIGLHSLRLLVGPKRGRRSTVAPALARGDDRPMYPADADASIEEEELVGAPRRIGLRAASLVAVSGALASAAPSTPAQAESDPLVGAGGRVLTAGVRDGAGLSWIVASVCAVIALGLLGGMRTASVRPASLRAPRRVRRPSPPER